MDEAHDDMAQLPKAVNMPWLKKGRPFGNDRFEPSFYQSKEWKAFRKWYESQHPRLCMKCLEQGITKEAKYLDHIIPISQGGARLSEANVQWLCVKCNVIKSNQDRMNKNK